MAWLSTQATPLARLRWPGNAPTAVALANRAFGGWKQPPAAVAQPPAAAALPPAAAKPSNGLISAKNAKNRKPKRGCPQKNFQKKSFLVFRVHRCHKWPYLDFFFWDPLGSVTSRYYFNLELQNSSRVCQKRIQTLSTHIPLPNSASNTLKIVLSCRNHRLQSFLNETSRY
jgi:hypothetical protein